MKNKNKNKIVGNRTRTTRAAAAGLGPLLHLGFKSIFAIPALIIVLMIVVRQGGHVLWIVAACAATVLAVVAIKLSAARRGRRTALEYPFPAFLRKKLRTHYPALTDRQIDEVERGLRQFFIASASAGGKFVAMPSKVVDALWHEFILHTRGYETFCRKVFGRMLHHTPTEALAPEGKRKGDGFAGIRRAWYWSCKEEGINPRKPDRLPLLFALDTTLAIPGGYHYVPDCRLIGSGQSNTYCAAGIGCGGSSCGSDGGGSDGDGDGCGSDGGCGGGCGGGD